MGMSWLFILKAVGSLLILAGSTMVGYVFSGRLTQRIEIIREIQGLLMELENEIHYMGRPLGQALQSYANGKTGELAQFSRTVAEMYREENATIESAWQESLKQFRDQWPIHTEEWNLLLNVGEVLGKTDKQGQSAFIKMMRDKFLLQEKKAEEERAGKDKLYKNLGALGGLALVLVLI